MGKGWRCVSGYSNVRSSDTTEIRTRYKRINYKQMIASRYRQVAYYWLEWDSDGWVYQYGDLIYRHLSSCWQLDESSRTHSRRVPVTNDEVGVYYQYTPRFPSLQYTRKSSKMFPPINISDNKRSLIFRKQIHWWRNGNVFQKVGWIVYQRILVTVADHQVMN